MNLHLYKAVLRRFRWLVVAGLLLGIALAFLSYVRVSFDKGVSLTYRQQELWESSATLMLTDRSFQLGRDPRYADPYRFSGLAEIYARLASSDEVRRIRRSAWVPGKFFAVPDYSRAETPLPTITTFGHAATPSAAKKLVSQGTAAFIRYVTVNQREASIPQSQRILLSVVNAPQTPQIIVPRRKTLPIVVFLAVLTATIALAFVLENLSPRAPVTRVAAEDAAHGQTEPGVRVVAGNPSNDQPVVEEEKVISPNRWA